MTCSPEEFDAALRELRMAADRAWMIGDTARDSRCAFVHATTLGTVLRELSERAARHRALVAQRIFTEEATSLASLADRIGMSKARAGQLMIVARRARQTEE